MSKSKDIFEAIKADDIEEIKVLIKDKSVFNTYRDNSTYAETPFLYAISLGKVEIVELMLDKGADINQVDCFSHNTALHYATRTKNNEEIFKILFESKNFTKNFNDKNRYGLTALHFAIIKDDDKTVKLALDNGADLSDITILQYTLKFSNKKILKLLLEKGIDVNAKDAIGRTLIDLENNDVILTPFGHHIYGSIFYKSAPYEPDCLGLLKFYQFISDHNDEIANLNSPFSEQILKYRSLENVPFAEIVKLLEANTNIELFNDLLKDENVIAYLESCIRDQVKSLENLEHAKILLNQIEENRIDRDIKKSLCDNPKIASTVMSIKNILKNPINDAIFDELYNLVTKELPPINARVNGYFLVEKYVEEACKVMKNHLGIKNDDPHTVKAMTDSIEKVKKKFSRPTVISTNIGSQFSEENKASLRSAFGL